MRIATGENHGDRIRLPFAFDPVRLAADLEALADTEWTPHFVTCNYQGEWSAMPLRAPAGAEHPILMITAHPGVTDFVDAPPLARAPYLQQVIAAFDCPLRSARLMRLTPGSVILEHSDPGMAAEEGSVRLHLPIVTNAQVEFNVNRRPVPMAPGEVWYLRLSDPHSVANRGPTDRVHLVIDAEVNDWLADQLAAGTS
ncbi:aspartyl/asparaginyl beta-hydroxylase domain-containing protein [Sphingomonas sp. DT-207]|uniref:aspartyl/asparaginyl beta-hydroxylase domain-containing protein n=1 Tax=Sphingomonas sp. DT-207 TaxID=3396167 RepID=UPI003F1DEB1F